MNKLVITFLAAIATLAIAQDASAFSRGRRGGHGGGHGNEGGNHSGPQTPAHPPGQENGGGGAPEPTTLALLAAGSGIVALRARRKNKDQE